VNPEEHQRLGVQNALQARALLLVGFGILTPLVVLGFLISSALDDL
jgi:hypothetical protein